MMDATFVIVGGGIAGVSCAEGLAFLSPSETVILVTASPTIKAVTNIRPLSKHLFQFDVEEKEQSSLTSLYPNVRVVQGKVASVNYNESSVTTEEGVTVKYKRLCVCTGASPKLIADNPYVIGIRDTDSVEAFQKRLTGAKKVLVVGNGGIATELVHEMKGVEIVWSIKDKHIAAPFIDPGAAEFFWKDALLNKDNETTEKKKVIKRTKYTLDNKGSGVALGPDWHVGMDLKGLSSSNTISVEYNTQVEEVRGPLEGWPVSVKLTNRKVVGCDFIVSATGVTPNVGCFKDLQLSEDSGIKVDWKMETSREGIFAAGDVCSAGWEWAPHWFQMRLWTQAHQMGTYAAKAMSASLDGEAILQDFCFEMFTHVTSFFGFKVVLLGLYNGQTLNSEYEMLVRMTPKEEYIKIVVKDGKLQGAVLIGETDLEEMVENLVLDQLDVTPLLNDLLNPDIDIEDYFD